MKLNFDGVLIHVETTLNSIINQYISKFRLDKKAKEKEFNMLIDAAKVDELNYENLKNAVANVAAACSEIELDAGADYMEMIRWRKSIEEIGSILRIARSHPESATKRLQDIDKTPVRPIYVLKPEY